ncbi:MAG: glucose-6-phosphate isomerase [Clostridia bacterium]|nr:glucose-6-phosphate isomerase [Clostridia bacterium]
MTQLSCRYTEGFVNPNEVEALWSQAQVAHKLLHEKTGLGNDYTGWVDWPTCYDKDEFARIQAVANKIRETADVLIVIGIGGSYLGAKAAIDMLAGTFYNAKSREMRNGPQIYFAGNSISASYLQELKTLVTDASVAVNVISKSGTTTEPAIAFRVFKELLEKKYGKEGAKERIFVTTDKARGALYSMAAEEGYERFVIPDDIGGRYSVLTPVGLLPIAVAGIPIDAIMAGAQAAMEEYSVLDLAKNDCYRYAIMRNALYRKGKNIEILVNYEGALHYVAEWWKQLYGESEGKDQKGIFPAAVDFSTDLHSMGQYIQDGLRCIFETVLHVKNTLLDIQIPDTGDNLDGLSFLAGKSVDYVNKKAFLGTLLAHNDGGVPNMVIEIDKMDAYSFGHMVYFFEKACGISGYILGVNPFNQPGVEAYKKNMFALLGKPGYEKEKEALQQRLCADEA